MLGKLIRKAKSASYWQDTIFLVIADHDSRVAGATLFPVDHFRIPAIIFGEGISPGLDQRLASQLDIPPTLLSLAGINGFHSVIGHDLSRDIDPDRARAMMQYGTDFAWMDGERVIILRANEDPRIFTRDGKTLGLEINEIDKRILARARSNALWANLACRKGYDSPSKMHSGRRIARIISEESEPVR